MGARRRAEILNERIAGNMGEVYGAESAGVSQPFDGRRGPTDHGNEARYNRMLPLNASSESICRRVPSRRPLDSERETRGWISQPSLKGTLRLFFVVVVDLPRTALLLQCEDEVQASI